MVPGDVMPGGFQIGRALLWPGPDPLWPGHSGWYVAGDYGHEVPDLPLMNEPSGPGFTVTQDPIHGTGDAVIPDPEDVPWKVGGEFLDNDVWYQRWQVIWYKQHPVYEELYDWTECTPCGSGAYNAQRHWVSTGNRCLACYSLQSSSFIGPAPGSDVPANATTLHYISIAWSNFFNTYRWFTVRRFTRPAAGGTKAPKILVPFAVQTVWEVILPASEGQPTDYPKPTGYGVNP